MARTRQFRFASALPSHDKSYVCPANRVENGSCADSPNWPRYAKPAKSADPPLTEFPPNHHIDYGPRILLASVPCAPMSADLSLDSSLPRRTSSPRPPFFLLERTRPSRRRFRWGSPLASERATVRESL